jgi:hypothetical protein
MVNDVVLKELSATGIAKELNKSTQAVFQQMEEMKYIIRNGDIWDLTSAGKAIGGTYKTSDKYGRYIVWPESILTEFEVHQEETGQLVTATTIGRYFQVPPNRINSILSELGWIKRDTIKGWLVTDLGLKMGGSQTRDRKSGIPYVRWPKTIIDNKILINNILEAKGEEVPNTQEQPQNVTQDSMSFRDKFPPPHRTQDGHYVRSKSEIIIDNWLYNYKIVHSYERKVPIEEELYCDFYIPTGKVYIEYWGLDDEKYLARKQKKLEIYKRNGLKLIQIGEKDISNLEDILPAKLLEYEVPIE